MKAFTLAEVLIVLGIIGLIADMTIPTLHQKIEDKIAVTTLKKTYSVLESAFRLASAKYGPPDEWGIDMTNSNLTDYLAENMNIIKNCKRESGCLPITNYRYISGNPYGDNASNLYSKFQTADGSIIIGLANYPACNANYGETKTLSSVCAHIYVDINGYKKPNQWGRDYFMFYLTKYGIVPSGTQADKAWMFEKDCLTKISGVSCAGWVIYNENMDYMHCSDLSWESKYKCK